MPVAFGLWRPPPVRVQKLTNLLDHLNLMKTAYEERNVAACCETYGRDIAAAELSACVPAEPPSTLLVCPDCAPYLVLGALTTVTAQAVSVVRALGAPLRA